MEMIVSRFLAKIAHILGVPVIAYEIWEIFSKGTPLLGNAGFVIIIFTGIEVIAFSLQWKWRNNNVEEIKAERVPLGRDQ